MAKMIQQIKQRPLNIWYHASQTWQWAREALIIILTLWAAKRMLTCILGQKVPSQAPPVVEPRVAEVVRLIGR